MERRFQVAREQARERQAELQEQQALLQLAVAAVRQLRTAQQVQTKASALLVVVQLARERMADLMTARFVANPNRSFFASTPRARRLAPHYRRHPRKCSRKKRLCQSAATIWKFSSRFTTPNCRRKQQLLPSAKTIFSISPEMEKPKPTA